MSKGRLITRSVTNTRPADMTLNLECSDEPLSLAQLTSRLKLQENYEKVASMMEEIVKEHRGTLVCQTGMVAGYQYNLPSSAPTPMATVVKPSNQMIGVNQNNNGANQTIKLNMLNNSTSGQGNIQLVMDPRMVILGTVAPQQGTISAPTKIMSTMASTTAATMTTMTTATTATPVAAPIAPVTPQPQSDSYKLTRSARRSKVQQLQVQQPEIIEEAISSPMRQRQTKPNTSTHVVTPTSTSSQGIQNLRIKTIGKPAMQQSLTMQQNQQTNRPTEQTSIGGIAIGSKNAVGEQIEDAKKNLPDGKEITFNKIHGGRTFPSLVVVARPNLRTKNITSQIAQKERTDLDVKVKGVLMFSATKFAEWLIQQGLVRSEQYCEQHSTNYQKTKLKLGMYSDSGTFPYSGGYVWISSCCPDRFVSVFSGSIFQGAPYTPTVLLKLVYHWACQTNVQNVISWVKVTSIYVKNFYTNLRSICTSAVWDKCKKMGGKNSMIQVGVISLGTTSQDGNLRQVKVEVLGLLDPETQELRLRACDPINDGDRSYKRRFNNILSPLEEWVHKESKILTDFTVDKGTLHEMGFMHVTQSTFSDQNPRNYTSNYHIMEYLRKIVPRMFQNTLSLLSRQMIQQFLDELVWREMFGTTALRAFDNIIMHLAEQTKIDHSETLLDRLSKIAANPFIEWSYTGINAPTGTQGAGLVGSTGPPPLTPMVSIPKDTGMQSNVDVQSKQNDISRSGSASKKTLKRAYSNLSPDAESSRMTPEPKISRDVKSDQVPIQELYYSTMEEDSSANTKEPRTTFNYQCFLCTASMHSNTEVMDHTISHVPAQIPGQSDAPVCRYCCTTLSSKHQMITHVTEAHSNFGHSDSDMLVCAICEQKFGSPKFLVSHLTQMHLPSEMPYRCETCGYRTSSHKDVIDHYYKVHDKGEGLQCPFCLKVVQFVVNKQPIQSKVHAFLLHLHRHVMRRGDSGIRCPRCCLWFNQMSSLKAHLAEMHETVTGPSVVPYSVTGTTITVSRTSVKIRNQMKRFNPDEARLPADITADIIKKYIGGSIKLHIPSSGYSCQECEEDLDTKGHFPGEQRCLRCRYVTCCWRAFKEHQRQIHNERPMMSVAIPSPLVNIPLEREMQCPCGFASRDGNILASHLIKCRKHTAFPVEDSGQSGMLDSLGLVPRPSSEVSRRMSGVYSSKRSR